MFFIIFWIFIYLNVLFQMIHFNFQYFGIVAIWTKAFTFIFFPLFCCILQETTYFSAYSGNTIGLVGKKRDRSRKSETSFVSLRVFFLQTFLQTPFLFLISVFDFIWVFEVFFICLFFFFALNFSAFCFYYCLNGFEGIYFLL